ncbi:hypothetical protein AVEN_244092-1, partial [Araneus ventricosus]
MIETCNDEGEFLTYLRSAHIPVLIGRSTRFVRYLVDGFRYKMKGFWDPLTSSASLSFPGL